MSRALKIIDGIIIALFIAIGAALLIPQFFGIDPVTVQQNMAGNVDVGSTIYARREDSSTIQAGDRILDLQSDAAYIYTVTSFDPDTKTVEVTGALQDSYTVSERYLHVLAVVPLIGYLMIATQSTEGILILVLLLVFVIVLFVASEMIKKNSEADEEEEDEEDEDSDEDDDFYAKLAEKRKKERAEREKAFSERNGADGSGAGKGSSPGNAGPEGMTELSKDVPDDTQHEEKPDEDLGTDSLPDVQAALEAALENQPLNRTEETQPQPDLNAAADELEETDSEPIANENGEIELAMPVRTADELLQKAYAKGLDPTVTEDPATGVTLVDYSDCL